MAPTMQSDNKYYLVVVADESKAVLYSRERLRGPLQEMRTFENEAARLKTDDIIADRGGRAFDSHGQGRHTMTAEKSDPKQHLAEGFARQIAEHIAAEQHKGVLRGYALIAAPRFLGMLRGFLNKQCEERIEEQIGKNLVERSIKEIRANLPKLL
mgnify:CR=1 FL=1